MNKRTNDIRNAKVSFGTWLTTGSPVISELAAQYPFNWLLFDMEHGNIYDTTLLPNFQSIRNENTAIIVRVGSPDPALIGKVLDLGADGIMVPHVSTAKQAEECVQAMYYPPRGVRGYSSSVRAYRYGNNPPEDIAGVRPLLLAQIEDKEGVDNANDIAAIKEVDVLFVGPADLKLSLSVQAEQSMSYGAARQQVLDAAIQNNKKAGILLRDYSEIAAHVESGFTCIGINSDLAILRQGYKEIFSVLDKF